MLGVQHRGKKINTNKKHAIFFFNVDGYAQLATGTTPGIRPFPATQTTSATAHPGGKDFSAALPLSGCLKKSYGCPNAS